MTEQTEKQETVKRTDYLKVQKQKKAFEDSMNPENPEYARCFKNFNGNRNFKTLYWRYGYMPKNPPFEFFHAPPVEEAIQSGRVVFVGNLREKEDMEKILSGINPYLELQKALENIKRGRKRIGHDLDVKSLPAIQTKNILPFKIENLDDIQKRIELLIPTYICFWDYFFRNDQFLEKTDWEITIPSLIVGTNHKDYRLPRNGLFCSKPEDVEFEATGKTFDLPSRLEEIASPWGIPLKIIDVWHQ